MTIDVHAHCFPADYLDLIIRYGSQSAGFARGMRAGDSPEELDARFALMDRAGIEMQILSVSPQLPCFDDESHAVNAARLVNDAYADLVRRFPTRFAAFAALPLPHMDESVRELDRAMNELGMVGATVTTTILDRSLVDPAFEPIYAELDRRRATLFVHPAGRAAQSPLIADAGLTWSIGAPVEDTVAATQLIAGNFPLRYPNMHIILSHLGGALPLLLKRLDHQLPQDETSGAVMPGVQARRLWYDSVSHNDVVALRCAADAFGSSQILLGTDFPYLSGDWFIDAVAHIGEAGLGEIATTRILDTNTRELFGWTE